MAYGPNRSAARPRASFQAAGGSIILFRHPKLSGQISGATQVDEIDVSRALKLNDTFLTANPSQDASFQEPLVDGSIITITNHLLAGTLTLQALSTTGFVGTGDFIEALHLIQASKDTEGGTLTVIEIIDGKRRGTVFYGVAVKNVPHLLKAGNAVVTYPVVLNYAGWFRVLAGGDTINRQTIWAVGNRLGITAEFKPFDIQAGETGGFYAGAPASGAIGGLDAAYADAQDYDVATIAAVPATLPDGVVAGTTMETVTWE